MTLKLNARPDAHGWIDGDYITPEGEVIGHVTRRDDIQATMARIDIEAS